MTLLDLIVAEIERDGPISFSRYMELALYHPEWGFYASGGAGRRDDFMTSPEVGPLFGAVVARALDSWWDEFGQPDNFAFVDVGAGPATLARTILRAPPRCLHALEYVAVETSRAQRDRHPVSITSVAQMPTRIDVGVVFANELLDNVPFDIAQYSAADGWQNVFVGIDEAGLAEVYVPMRSGSPPEPDIGSVDVVRVPMQRQAARWLQDVRERLGQGRVVVIDYAVAGYPTEPARDWLRTYSRHASAGSVLEGPGTRDITADVDVSCLVAISPADQNQSQRSWLKRHGIDILVQQGSAHWNEHAGAPDLLAIEMRSRVNEAEALLDPTGLGGFTVLEWLVQR